MKHNTTTLLLTISLAAVTGLFGLTASGILGDVDSSSSTVEKAFLVGHVAMTVTGPDGEIKAYKQSDNLIVSSGEDCAALALFNYGGATSTGTTVCEGSLTEGYNFIALGNYTMGVNNTNTSMGRELVDVGSGMIRSQADTITMTNSSGSATGTQVVLSETFTNSAGKSVTVEESGLFNATGGAPNGDGLFARQLTGTVTVGDGDDLTVEWTINIGGATTLDAT